MKRTVETHRITTAKWIFFDLGSTLIDETKADLHRIQDMTEGSSVTIESYCEKRLEMIRQGLPGDLAAIASFGLTKTPWHSEDEIPYPDWSTDISRPKAQRFQTGCYCQSESRNRSAPFRLGAAEVL